MRIPFLKQNRTAQSVAVGEFAHQHSNLLVIVADPADDTVFVAFKDQFVGGRIKDRDGKNIGIIKDMLNASTFESRVDSFLLGLADAIKLRKLTAGANNVLQFLDGALFNIAQRHRQAEGGRVLSTLQPDPVEPGRVKEIR